MRNRPTLGLLALALVLVYQNCTPGPSASSSLKARHLLGAGTAAANNGGQPYDGKPYVMTGSCPDGTLVKSRLVLKGDYGRQGATLYRDDCQSESARDIAASALQFPGGDRVAAEGRLYSGERPAIPLPGMISWYYQLQGALAMSRPPGIYILDMFDTSPSAIAALKTSGHTVICTISAGTVESWRPDAASFAAADVGRRVNGANDERWLDTRSTAVRARMRARLDLAKSKGCQGIDFDGVDGYENNTGFPLNTASQLEYNRYLAFAAHDRGLILSLNNVPGLAENLSTIFDFAIAEQCFEYGECGRYSSFVERGKPVLAAEYTSYSAGQCAGAEAQKLSLVFLSERLDGSRYETCP